MQQTRSRVLVAGLAAALTVAPLAACKKEGSSSSSPVAALVPADTANKLSSGLLAFAEELPAGLDAFGYLDFGQSLEQMTGDQKAFADYRLLYADMTEMVQRRFGVELKKLSGLGFVVFQQKPLLVAAVPSKPPQSGEVANDVMLGQLGKLTVVGAPDAVAALLAAGKQGKRLYQSNAAWMRSAMSRAAGNVAFATVDMEKALAAAPVAAKAMLGDLLTGTLAVGASGAVAAASCKPGSAGKVKALVEQGITMGKALIEAEQANLANEPSGLIAAVLLRHYSGALWKSIEQKVSGDELLVSLGWHAPAFPEIKPVSIAERVVVPGEIAVAQVNFGSPVLEMLIALTDILKSPLDRAALKKELSAELATLIGVPGIEPRAVTVSAGMEGVIISAHNAQVAPPGSPLALAGGEVAALGTTWGLAFSPTSPTNPQPVADALTAKDKGLAISGIKLFEDKANVFRGYLDLTKVPPQLLADLPTELVGMVHNVAVAASTSRFDAEITSAPGKAKALAAELMKLTDQFMPPEVTEMYKNRAKGSVLEEFMGITANFQREALKKYLTPASVSGDKLVFVSEMSQPQMQVMASAAIVGMAAAVAIPAFMMYRVRATMPDLDDDLDRDLGGPVRVVDPSGTGADQVDDGEQPGGTDTQMKMATPEEVEKQIEEMKKEMERMEKEMKALGIEPAPQK